MAYLLIFLGGGLGASARYTLTQLIPSQSGKIPYAILSANLIGCLLIGLAYGLIKSHHPSWISPLLLTGFLGGFTTFSTFALDTQQQLSQGLYGTALLYLGLSILGGLSLTYVGIKLA